MLRERWAFARIGLNVVLIQLALTLPGTLALTLRGDNAVEGVVAVTVAGGLSVWQVYRLATSGVVVQGNTIRRLGPAATSITIGGPDDLSWHAGWFTTRGGQATAVYKLRARGVELTRYPCMDAACIRFTDRLRQAGLLVRTPAAQERVPPPAARTRRGFPG